MLSASRVLAQLQTALPSSTWNPFVMLRNTLKHKFAGGTSIPTALLFQRYSFCTFFVPRSYLVLILICVFIFNFVLLFASVLVPVLDGYFPGRNFVPFKQHFPSPSQSTVFAHNATVVGDVAVGDSSSIWFNAVVRGVCMCAVGIFYYVQVARSR